MKKLLFYIICILFTHNLPAQQAKVSELVQSKVGKYYLQVDGKPWFYNAVQSWYPPEEDYTFHMQKR